jgi:2OG-Fe(II) oxygenase superfamily
MGSQSEALVELTDFSLDRGALLERARELAQRYRAARPFPHVVIDGLLPDRVVDACADEFPDPGDERWNLYTDAGNSLKLATSDPTLMGPVTRQLIAQFNGMAMTKFLEELTGIEGLVPDPHLLGGGMHQLNHGGFLRVHADFNVHPRLRLERRINALLYLNRDWKPEYGGQLELWDEGMERCERSVDPETNRIVIFNTTSTSYHGNPRPVASPPGVYRRSLAFYYYSAERPAHERQSPHSTLYRTPRTSGEPEPTPASARFRRVAARWLPPAVADAVRRIRSRRRGS